MSAASLANFIASVRANPAKYKAGLVIVARQLGTATLSNADIAANRKLIQLGADWPDLVWLAYTGGAGALKWSDGTADAVFNTLRAAPDAAQQIVTMTPSQFGTEAAERVLLVLDDAALSPHPQVGGYMRQLIGKNWLTQADILTAMAQGTRIVDNVVVEVVADQADKAALLDDLYAVRGISEFFATVTTRSGKQWGGELEVRSIAILILDGAHPTVLRLSMPMVDGKLGPDIIKYLLSEYGDELFEILECKALADFGQIAAERAHSAVTHKMGSTISRLGAQGWQTAAKGKELTDAARATWDGRFTFLFDFHHFWNRCADPIEYIRNFVRRHQPDADLDFGPEDAPDIAKVVEAMAEGMGEMGIQMTDMFNAIKHGDVVSDMGQALIVDLVNGMAEAAAIAAKRTPPAPIALNNLTPQELFRVGVISADEVATLAAMTPDELWREAGLRTMGLTTAMVQSMPDVQVHLKLVFKAGGDDNGSFFGMQLFQSVDDLYEAAVDVIDGRTVFSGL